ncbi:radical SAM protein, partial [Streptomyces rubellomurinus subsp. indigoferus]
RLLAGDNTGASDSSYRGMTSREPAGPIVTNNSAVRGAAELSHDIGCEDFENKAMCDDEHHVVEVPQDILDAVERQLAEAARLRSDSFQLVNSSTLTSLRRHSGPVQP